MKVIHGSALNNMFPMAVVLVIITRISRSMLMAKGNFYRVTFLNQGKVYEVYARKVSQGDLFGFIEIEQLVFGNRSTVVVDPGEEKLKTEFTDVKRSFIPMHAIVRIDEVAKQGIAKISEAGSSNVSQFPLPVYTPSNEPGKN